jgi:peptidoglycan-N-acetylmuramic acid deacetylase
MCMPGNSSREFPDTPPADLSAVTSSSFHAGLHYGKINRMIHHESKKRKNPVRRSRVQREGALLTTVILLTSTTILIGVYALGSRLDVFGGPSSGSSITSSPGIPPSSSASEDTSSGTSPSVSPEPTETPTPTSTPTLTPSPTLPPASPGSLSTRKLGWFYYASNKEGVPPNISTSQKSMCDRFGGIWQGDTSVKKVYITMDVGYEYNNNTTKILDIAKEKDVQLTFFVVGNLFTKDNLKAMFLRMHNEGHLIANHSWNHPKYDELFARSGTTGVEAELRKAEDAYTDLTGEAMAKYFRFPSGEYSEAVMSFMNDLGYKSVFWSFAYRDWLIDDQPNPATARQTILKGLHNGAVLLLHTVSNTNVEILPELIDEIRARGYEIGRLDELG